MAIAEGFRARGLQSQLDELKARQAALTARLNTLAPTQPRLHPNPAEVYRDKAARLRESLQSGPDAQEALDAGRRPITRIVLTPVGDGDGFKIELIGEIAAMVHLGLTISGRTSRPHRIRTTSFSNLSSVVRHPSGAPATIGAAIDGSMNV
jgi:site-specific DNA recombinase